MRHSLLSMLLTICILAMCQPVVRAEAADRQVLELRKYTLIDKAAEEALDHYLEVALIPALIRQGLGPVGAFAPAEPGEGPVEVLLLVAGPDVAAVTGAAAKLATDKAYQRAAAEYLNTPADQPLLQRIRSELLLSFACWPQVVVPAQKTADQDRLFELRTYESPTEKLGDLKVEMFNSGEVPIFLACDVQPVFMGQALIGDKLPNLTYMTVYDNDAARQQAWQRFVAHPDWEKLKAVGKYQGTVSTIHKSDWVPKSYSQL